MDLLLSLLYLLLPTRALLPVGDPDLWWHFRTGQWIAEHGDVPHTDSFSSYGFGKTWIAYSWLFDLLVYWLQAGFGLMGIVWFTLMFSVAISFAIHLLVRRRAWNFVQEILLTVAILISIKNLISPRSWLFSILFFALEMRVLLDYRDGRDDRLPYWLPGLFLLWSNLHIQFVYGLAALFIVILEPFIQRALAKTPFSHHLATSPPPSRKAIVITFLCLVATTCNPYGVYVYKPVWEVIQDTKAFDMIMELQPLSFRSIDEWVLVSLLFLAVFCIAKRSETRLWHLAILALGIFLSFRARRDVWFGVMSAAVVMVDRRTDRLLPPRISWRQTLSVMALVAIGAFYLARTRHISENELIASVAKQYPVGAANFIKKEKIPGPLYNHYDWGGFLIWSLSGSPVSIDGRSNLHTEQRVEQSRKTWWGLPAWRSDPDLTRANVIVAPNDLPLTSLLESDGRFKLCHKDEVATVFVRASQSNTKQCG